MGEESGEYLRVDADGPECLTEGQQRKEERWKMSYPSLGPESPGTGVMAACLERSVHCCR